MFSPERFGPQKSSFGKTESHSCRNFIGLKTAFRQNSVETPRTPLQQAARLRFSEPATPSVLDGRGYRASDLSDPHKRQFLTELTGRIFHLASNGDDAREDGNKISLERLFTPATDSGDLTPKKKKAYASSAFYRPDHPTIDDQVELAQRISFSLVDENNKLSRGQSMYMKRKKRASRWIHQGGGSGTEGQEDESPPHAPTKPAMKLLMNPKGVQDFHAVQQHYQTLMESAVPTSPEVNKIVTEIQSPTGKGAELFAKRKKRMDKFIVDETTVQKAQQQSTVTQQTVTTNASDTFAAKKQAEMERKKQQDQIMLANTVCERADSKTASWLEMPKPVPVNAPPFDTTPSVPHHSLHDLVNEDKEDKRRSASFNLAAKGWGTYNHFYTPITFATS